MADMGSLALAAAPWLDATFVKANSWILIDPVRDGANSAAARDTTNWDWAAPMPRHMEMCNTGYIDGHVKCTKPATWYYGNTPWLDPATGG
jgi:prepilin-type processing-associated H-X9-DG protein